MHVMDEMSSMVISLEKIGDELSPSLDAAALANTADWEAFDPGPGVGVAELSLPFSASSYSN